MFFSKFVKLFPLKKANAAAAVNRILHDLVPIYKPAKILSDHGTQFTSKIWRDRLKEHGIAATFSSIKYPASNPAERYMREIGRLFRTYCHDQQTKRAKYVTDIER